MWDGDGTPTRCTLQTRHSVINHPRDRLRLLTPRPAKVDSSSFDGVVPLQSLARVPKPQVVQLPHPHLRVDTRIILPCLPLSAILRSWRALAASCTREQAMSPVRVYQVL